MSIREEDELLGTFDLYDLDELETCDLDEIFSRSSFDQELNDELELVGFGRSW